MLFAYDTTVCKRKSKKSSREFPYLIYIFRQSGLYLISLMAKGIDYFFKYFPATWVSSIENSLFRSGHQFLIWLFGFLLSTFLGFLYILDISLLLEVKLVKIFTHSGGMSLCLNNHILCLTNVFRLKKQEINNFIATRSNIYINPTTTNNRNNKTSGINNH